MVVPVAIAWGSPLLQWREPVYIAAGLAGVVALALLLVQPLLATRLLPGLTPHVWTGSALVAAVAVHVAGLWVTSPPDVVDALTFASPTPFSVWGVLAMWALFGAAALAALRGGAMAGGWRLLHVVLTAFVVAGTVVHAVQIDGTMGTVSKWALSALVVAALAAAVWHRRRVLAG